MRPDNPPALPRPESTRTGEEYASCSDQEGMSLRDWFAGQALAGVIVGIPLAGVGMPECQEGCNRIPAPEAAADSAYRYADAMLARRKES